MYSIFTYYTMTLSAGAEFCPSTVFEIYKEILVMLFRISRGIEIDSESSSNTKDTKDV